MSPPQHSRPNLLPTSAFVSLLVLLLGAVGLFALSYSHKKSSAALERLDAFHDAQISAVEAQISFKTQVQEWKNILLRGHDPADFKTYREHFEKREADVRTGLTKAKEQMAALGQNTAVITRLLDEHAKLGASYRKALADYQSRSSDPATAIAVDASIRGIDRPLNDGIDALARTVDETSENELQALSTAAISRYAMLRKVTLIFGALAVFAAFCLVFQANRAASRG